MLRILRLFPHMLVPIVMPQLGESVVEATVLNLNVNVGDEVSGDQEIIEVETNKAILHVTAPAPGKITRLQAEPQGVYAVGTVLGYLEVAPADAERLGLSPAPTADGAAEGAAASQIVPTGPERSPAMPEVEPGTDDNDTEDNGAEPTPSRNGTPGLETSRLVTAPATTVAPAAPLPPVGGAGFLSPRVRARLGELNLQPADLAAVAGTGTGGRVTAEDLERFVAGLEARHPRPAPAMRLAIADAMRRSWTRPLATVGRPVALDAVLAHRRTFPDGPGRPGVALYAGRALALALAEDPTPADRLIGARLVPAANGDIAFAVESDDGILTPVLRGIAQTPLGELTARYAELLAATRARRLPPGEMTGAAATVTNYGPFGLTWATPIPLPDQTLILGLAAARKVPFWDEVKDRFVPVAEAEFTLSFDHRALDGGAAGRLLGKIASLLAKPEAL